MSFFGSLQHYVTSGVASLGLNSRRFSRQDSSELDKSSSASGSSGASSVGPTQIHGFPKVVPTPGTIALPTTTGLPTSRRQSARNSLEALAPPVRSGSFRQNSRSPVPTPVDKPALQFCKRRLSWPEVDPRSTSGVQETDGSYFESFTALAWKRENRRMSAVRAIETRAETLPENERQLNQHGNNGDDDVLERPDEKENLYMEVLHTIANTVGAPAPGGQYAHFKEEMYLQAQRAFGINPDRHYRLLHAAAEEKPKIIVLSVIVLEAEGLEAKDANGFSDPYCMLGIIPSTSSGGLPSPQPSQQPPMTPRTLSAQEMGFDGGLGSDIPTVQRKHSFRLSFKRKENNMPRREQRDSLGGPVPAKFIQATSVKPLTLSPKWNEKFKFDIDDINTDTFHLDIWDHDDESCVLDAVSRLNEVRGVRGLGRFFKQVCQSARQGSQDDFLGSVNIPIADIPSTGMEGWFKLEARSQRSTVQGRIRLKLWLSTRDDNGPCVEDVVNEIEVTKFEKVQMAFIAHELANSEPTWTWNGELPGPTVTILHQMAVQGDLPDLLCNLAKFVAVAKLNRTKPVDPKYIHKILGEIDKLWNQPNQDPISLETQQWIAQAMSNFVDKSMDQISNHRVIFPCLHQPSLNRLEYTLRCLGTLSAMKIFRLCCPFNKGVRGEIVACLRKGSIRWSQKILRESQKTQNPIVNYITTLIADVQLGLTYYHPLFDNTNGIQYFAIVYKQLDQVVSDEVVTRMEAGQIPGLTVHPQFANIEGDKDPADTRPFEIFLALQEFSSLRQHLSIQPQPPEKPLGLQNYHEWFTPLVEKWLVISKARALQRVRSAIKLDSLCEGEKIVRYSTSSIDTASCFYQMKEFWKLLQWADFNTAPHFEAMLIDAVCSSAMHYSDLIHQALADSGYYEQSGPFRCSDDMCVTVNNLEYIRRSLSEFRPDGQLMHDNAEALLESSLLHLETRAERVLSKLAPLMQTALQKAIFHLAWSPDSLPANQASVPLMEYLDVHLSALNSALLTKNFNRSLTLIWSTVLSELARQMDTDLDHDKPSNFHSRLHEALQLLVEFFHADGLGLSMESLHCDGFWRVEQRLQYHKTDTDKLIDMFYMLRLQEQYNAQLPGPFGHLSVRAYFNHDSLCVEVLHAKDIIPLDPNGFSDPFVIIELLPKKIFSHCTEQQTNVHKRTLNPVFDECFEFSVSLSQCQADGAMIVFTVMDHDVLTANDFGGEAFLALGSIPGVSDYSSSVDNFHGLKQVDLALMQQHDKNHPILQILETRLTDRIAQEFVRRQRARLASQIAYVKHTL